MAEESPAARTPDGRTSAALSEISLGDASPGASGSKEAPAASSAQRPNPPQGAGELAAAWEQVGGCGRAQYILVAAMGACWAIQAASFSLPIFTAAPPERLVRRCPQQAPHNAEACHVGTELSAFEWCDEAYREFWEYKRPLELVTAEWDIICENRMLASSVGSAFFFGILGGNAAFGPVPDKIGRCRSFVIAAVLTAIGASICVEASSFSMFLAGRLWAGFGFGGLGMVAWLVATEVVGKEYSSQVMLAMNFIWALGIVLLAMLTYVFPAWRSMSRVLAFGHMVTCVWGLLAWYAGIDSPAWLAATGREESFNNVMTWIARLNRREYIPPQRARLPVSVLVPDAPSAPEAGKDSPGKCSDMCCKQPVASWTIRFIWAYCCCSLGYYGLSLNAGNLGSNAHVSTALTGIVEIPALLVAKRLADHPRIGRRGTVVSGLGASGCLCLFSAALPAGSPLTTAVAMMGKLCVTMGYCTVLMQTGEAYPAVVRGTAFGLMNTFSRVTGILAPVVVMFPAPWPFLYIGIALALCAVISLGLPETLGRQAPTSLTEACQQATVRSKAVPRKYRELDEETQVGDATVIGRRAADGS